MLKSYLLAALIPPLAVFPLHVAWMVFLRSKGELQFALFAEIPKMMRFVVTFLYPLALIVHVLIGGLAFLVARKFQLDGVAWWILLYMVPLAAAALKLSDTWLDLQGAGVHLIFALVICLATWPFISPIQSSAP